jgi:putative spermidine/putrescine transport system permease protein
MADEARIGAGRSTRSLGWAIVLFLVLPITIVVPVSLTDQRFCPAPGRAVLRHYPPLGAGWLHSIWQSFAIAVASTAIAVAAGTLCAIGCWRWRAQHELCARSCCCQSCPPSSMPRSLPLSGNWTCWTVFGVALAHGVTGIPAW